MLISFILWFVHLNSTAIAIKGTYLLYLAESNGYTLSKNQTKFHEMRHRSHNRNRSIISQLLAYKVCMPNRYEPLDDLRVNLVAENQVIL